MPRFTWNEPENGRLINRYIDTMCRDFPAIMRVVAKKGIKGSLGSWFDEDNAEQAKCGCLVGTTCIAAINKYDHLTDEQKESVDAALILYELIVRKSKRDVNKYETVRYASNVDVYSERPYDPLLVLIYHAGIAASDETDIRNPDWNASDDERDEAERYRHKQVIDRIEHRIRTKLGIPYPKQRKRAK